MEDTLVKKSKKSKKKVKIPAVINEDASSSELVIVDEMAPITPLTLTPTSSTSTTKSKSTPTSASSSSANNKKRRKRDSASSDEERWLTAIESGKLEDVDDELKKIKPKDPALMTARQRAMYDRGSTESSGTLMSLPTGYKEKVMTAEAIQKAAIKSLKRKQLADEKREKDKKKTMERLLKKQESKAAKAAAAKSKVAKTNVPVIIYRQNNQVTMLSLPDGMDFPLKSESVRKPREKQFCACGNVKKYSCSKTGVPLCSLKCYKNNLDSIIS